MKTGFFATTDQEQEICKLYVNDKKTSRDVAAIFKCDKSTILKILKKNKIPRRDQLNCRIRNAYNREYFKKIDTQNKAYFLGLLCADGCNSGKAVVITLQEEDSYLLELFRKELDYKLSIKARMPVKTHHKIQMALQITCINFCDDLINLGCVPCKSLILKFPTPEQVPPHFVSHFIRGLFDGDGSIFISKSNPKGGPTRLEGGLNITSSTFVCNYLLKFFRQMGLRFNITRRNPKVTCSSLITSGSRNILRFYRYIYKDAIIYMKRKKDKFEEFLNMRGYLDGNKSQFRGVKKWSGKNLKNCFLAYLISDGRRKNLGVYSKEEDAAIAYDKMAIKIFGDKAFLNFPHEKEKTENTILLPIFLRNPRSDVKIDDKYIDIFNEMTKMNKKAEKKFNKSLDFAPKI